LEKPKYGGDPEKEMNQPQNLGLNQTDAGDKRWFFRKYLSGKGRASRHGNIPPIPPTNPDFTQQTADFYVVLRTLLLDPPQTLAVGIPKPEHSHDRNTKSHQTLRRPHRRQ
jgi:hypothetical protein